jgi:hypothetical protein
MISRLLRWVVGLSAATVVAAPAGAQSLADVARNEQLRRERVEAPSKTYTNADLTPDPRAVSAVETSRPLTSAAASEADNAGDERGAEPADGGAGAGAVVGEGLDEAYWRRRAAGFRLRVERTRAALEELSKPSEASPREQARLVELRARAEQALAEAEEDLWRFMQVVDARGVPLEWVR